MEMVLRMFLRMFKKCVLQETAPTEMLKKVHDWTLESQEMVGCWLLVAGVG